jgi:hypothetical protein
MLSNTRLDGKLKVSSVIAQSYSRYIGIEVTIPSGSNIPSALFNYMRSLVSASSELPNLAGIMLDTTGDPIGSLLMTSCKYFQIVDRSMGRKDIINIYKYDSNKVYHAVSNRFPLSKVSIPVFREMGLYLRYKKAVYKNGIPTSRSATSADAADFGLGLLTEIADNTKTSDINENEQDDLGRGLFDVGQVVELVSFSNINADIRSIEVFSPEDSLMYGGDRFLS